MSKKTQTTASEASKEEAIESPIPTEIRTTLKVDRLLDSLISSTAKSLGYSKQKFLILVLIYSHVEIEFARKTWNGEEWVDDPEKEHQIEKQWPEAFSWQKTRAKPVRKTYVLSEEYNVKSIKIIQEACDCTRDEAFTAGCLVGLKCILERLLNDDDTLHAAEAEELCYEDAFEFQHELKVISPDLERLPDMEAFFRKRASIHKKIRLKRRKAIVYAFENADQFPESIRSLFEGYSLNDLKDSDPLRRSDS